MITISILSKERKKNNINWYLIRTNVNSLDLCLIELKLFGSDPFVTFNQRLIE